MTTATSRRGRVVLAAVAAVLALAAAEVAARAVLRRWFPAAVNQYRFYRFDERLGWSGNPGAEGVLSHPDYAVPVRISRQGLRAPEFFVPEGRAVWAFMGDSFTWGIGVAEPDRFTDVIGRRLHGRARVVNFGNSGWGPLHHLLAVGDVLKIRPTDLFIVLCPSNDLQDNVSAWRYGYNKPVAAIDGAGRLEIRGYPLVNSGRFGGAGGARAGRGLALAELARRALWNVRAWRDHRRINEDLIYAPPDALSERERRSVDAAYRVNRRIFDEIIRNVREASPGTRVHVVVIPTKYEVSLRRGARGHVPNQVGDRLIRDLSGLPVRIIDARGALGPGDFLTIDGHWKPSGHLKLAEFILERAKQG